MSDLESRLDALRREYAASLPATIAEAKAAFAGAMAGEAGAIEAVWRIVHRTYGTAGSYGLTAVAEAARAIETALTPYRNDDALPAEVADGARQALDALDVQAFEAART